MKKIITAILGLFYSIPATASEFDHNSASIIPLVNIELYNEKQFSPRDYHHITENYEALDDEFHREFRNWFHNNLWEDASYKARTETFGQYRITNYLSLRFSQNYFWNYHIYRVSNRKTTPRDQSYSSIFDAYKSKSKESLDKATRSLENGMDAWIKNMGQRKIDNLLKNEILLTFLTTASETQQGIKEDEHTYFTNEKFTRSEFVGSRTSKIIYRLRRYDPSINHDKWISQVMLNQDVDPLGRTIAESVIHFWNEHEENIINNWKKDYLPGWTINKNLLQSQTASMVYQKMNTSIESKLKPFENDKL